MIRWIIGKWYARLRRIDIEILLPALRKQALMKEDAERAFRLHTNYDPAWQFLSSPDREDLILRLFGK